MRALPRLLTAVVFAWVAPVVLGSGPAAQTPAARNVLAIHWSSEDFPAGAQVDAAIRDVLLGRPDLPVDYYAEYLESDRFPEEEVSLALRDYIRVKYRDRPIHVVLAISAVALEFALRHRAELFPDAPVVFSLGAEVDPAIRRVGAGVTGVVSSSRSPDTLELAMRLHPTTRHVFVVAEAPGFALRESVESLLQGFKRDIEVSFIAAASVERLIAAVRAVPLGSVILYVRYSQETPGQVLTPSDVARLVAEASPVPVYGITESYIGSGVVGGVVSSSRTIGTRIGEITRQLLAGTRAQDIPIDHPALTLVFDWRQLRRWGVDRSKLPPNSEIRFEEPTAWDRYRWYIVGAIALAVLQALMITALAIERSRRRRSQKLYALATAAGGVGAWEWNLETNEVFVDSALKAALGYEDSEIGQQAGDWSRLLDTDDRAVDARARVQEHLDGGRPYYESEYKMRHRDGTVRWFLSRGSAVRHAGRAVRLVGTATDITERKKSQQALDDMQAELSRVSRLTALGEFAGAIAHELRQPLTTIIMNAKASLRLLDNAPSRQTDVEAALWDIVQAGNRAKEMIQRNRELFRHHTLRREPVFLNGVIHEVMALAGPRLRGSQVTLATSLAPDLPAITGDRIELQQVLLNLIANALDATDHLEQGLRRIEISTLPVAGFVQVSVTDNGVGLAGVDQKRLFTLSYTTKANGSGIGLSLSRSIVDAHGGRLWAEPNPNRGATFRFTVPVHPVEVMHIAAVEESLKAEGGSVKAEV
jgi:PAS domain S-box-containing protein